MSSKEFCLNRRGDSRFVLTNYAYRASPRDNLRRPKNLAQEIKLLLKELGGSAKGCAIAVSDPGSLLRIIEQPDTPVDLLRNALRLNGLAVLNQECKDFVLDLRAGESSGQRPRNERRTPRANGSRANCRRDQDQISRRRNVAADGKTNLRGLSKSRVSADILQLAPVCSFNAFEFAYPDIFANDAFLLLDMGHLQSTVLIGSKKELVLVRSIDYGGKALAQALTADGALDAGAAR